jgi:hypothetical protein
MTHLKNLGRDLVFFSFLLDSFPCERSKTPSFFTEVDSSRVQYSPGFVDEEKVDFGTYITTIA